MRRSGISLLSWLLVIDLGIALGAGLYESRVALPQWLSFAAGSGYEWNAAAARAASSGLRFWVYVTTMPLTLLTLLSLGAFPWVPREARGWWLGAALAALAERAMTFLYFIPTMMWLMRDEAIPATEAAATALSWARLGYLRHALTLLAWLLALKAFSLLGPRPGVES